MGRESGRLGGGPSSRRQNSGQLDSRLELLKYRILLELHAFDVIAVTSVVTFLPVCASSRRDSHPTGAKPGCGAIRYGRNALC
jgi:hypothetical protein